MTIFIVSVVAFLTAILTFFSGFGLGTILMPTLAYFFPLELAVALTGVVHFFNGLFKLTLVGRYADRNVVLRFGIPAILAAMVGAYLLTNIAGWAPIYSYQLNEYDFDILPLNLIIGILLVIFALMDLSPFFDRIQFGKDKLMIGGLLSGFFGGLSGHQGALRSAFLIKAGLDKQAFIGTAVVIACLIDFSRLGVYATRLQNVTIGNHLPLIIAATSSAIVGAILGHQLLKKVSLQFIHRFVAVMLLITAIAMILGWL